MTHSIMKIALACPPIPSSITNGLHWLEKLAEEAARQQAQIICFPESYLPGYPGMPYPITDRTPESLQAALKEVRRIASEQEIAIIVPMDWHGPNGLLNLAFVISSQGEILGRQTKNQLDPSEDNIWVPGTERQLFEVAGLKFGITICHEGFRYPESVRWAAQQGAQLVFHPHFSGGNTEGRELTEWGHKDNPYYEKAMMMRALENTIYFASSNYASRFSESGSAVIDPDGSCLINAAYGKPRVIIADLDLLKATGLLAKRFKNSLYALLLILLFTITSCTTKPVAQQDDIITEDGAAEHKVDSIKRADSTVAVKTLIVPGHSIGDINLNANAELVYKTYGKPDAGDAAMGKATAEWIQEVDTTKYSLAIYTARDTGDNPAALIKRIRVTNPRYLTSNGIGTNSSLKDLQQAFTLVKVNGYLKGKERVDVYADRAGIAFEINKDQHCIGIVVYEKGGLHPETYFGFLPGVSPIDSSF
jgi:predicted amidohydrolase